MKHPEKKRNGALHLVKAIAWFILFWVVIFHVGSQK